MKNIKSMRSHYYRFLQFPFEFFNQENLSNEMSKDLDLSKNKHWDKLVDIFNLDTHKLFSKFDYKIINAELFYTAPLGDLVWHIDMNPPEDFMKINFVWGASSHLMLWGELKDPTKIYQTSNTEVASQYIRLADYDVVFKESATINQPVMVNVGRPHKILNRDSVGRWCLSMIITHQNRRILFKDAINTLNEYAADAQ